MAGTREASVVYASMGFEKCCPPVWDKLYVQEGLVVTGGLDQDKFFRVDRMVRPGRRIVVYAPASHGGKGLLGSGIIEAPLCKVSEGTTFFSCPLAERLRSVMGKIFSDPSNEGMFSKRNQFLNAQYKCHKIIKDHMGTISNWERGRETWTSLDRWRRFTVKSCPPAMLPGRWIGCVKVRWESTVPFELGVMSVDGIPRVSRRLSVTVCRWGEPQIEALLAALRRRGAAAARGAAGGAAATPAEGRQGAAEAPRPTVAAHRGRRLLRRRLPAKDAIAGPPAKKAKAGREEAAVPAHWPAGFVPNPRATVTWLPPGWGAATRMTSGGRMARCYIGPKAEIAWSKKKVEQLEGRTLEASNHRGTCAQAPDATPAPAGEVGIASEATAAVSTASAPPAPPAAAEAAEASDEIKELQREIAELEAKLAAKGSEQSDIRSATISAPPEAAKAPLAPGAAPSPAAPGRPPAFSKALHGVRGCCYDLD